VGSGAGALYRRAVFGAIFIAPAAVGLASQSSIAAAQPDSVTSELAGRIAAAIAPAARVSLEVDGDDDALRNEIGDRLAALGVRVVAAADGVPSARAGCIDSLRERACSIDVTAAFRTTVILTRPLEAASRQGNPALVLELRRVLSQRAQMLDLVRVEDRILVLSPTAVAEYAQIDGGWHSVDSRAVPRTRPWPRDLRGRLRLAAGRVEAFLPGVTCAGDAEPLRISCSDGVAAWPLDVDDVSLDPARNYFRSPDGLAFYGAARLGGSAGARWLMATVDHTLTFVDDGGRSTGAAVAADDVVAVRVPCAPGSYVLASSAAGGRDADQLTLFEVAGRRLAPAAAPLTVTGKITALWPAANGEGATVISHDRNAGRYDAYELVVSCPR
jgi:hypothetical protein